LFEEEEEVSQVDESKVNRLLKVLSVHRSRMRAGTDSRSFTYLLEYSETSRGLSNAKQLALRPLIIWDDGSINQEDGKDGEVKRIAWWGKTWRQQQFITSFRLLGLSIRWKS